jgi:hypothetical protein
MLSFERRWARHVLAAFAPTGGPGLAPALEEVDYQDVFARMLRGASPWAAMGLRLALWIAALAPIWLWGRLTTVTKLAAERRPELLRQLLHHRAFAVRELTLLLKLCAAMALLGTPSVRARSGYDLAADVRSISPAAAGAARVHLRVGVPVSEPRLLSISSSSRPEDAGRGDAPAGSP